MLLAISRSAKADGTFVSASGRRDMVYDHSRDILYITHTILERDPNTGVYRVIESAVLRYQVGTNTFLPPFNIQGDLYGIDLSPDGNLLAVADGQGSGGIGFG